MPPLLGKIETQIINPVIYLLFGLALAYFLWGMLEFIAGAGNEETRTNGRQHMLWGVVGMFIMVAVFGIMHTICNTINC